MDVLSGGGDGGERPLRSSSLSRQKRHHVKRRASLSMLPLSDTFLFKAPQPTYVASSWPGELCVLVSTSYVKCVGRLLTSNALAFKGFDVEQPRGS